MLGGIYEFKPFDNFGKYGFLGYSRAGVAFDSGIRYANKRRGLVRGRSVYRNIFIILEPSILPIASPALPLTADVILIAASGALVPNATIVRPMTICGMPNQLGWIDCLILWLLFIVFFVYLIILSKKGKGAMLELEENNSDTQDSQENKNEKKSVTIVKMLGIEGNRGNKRRCAEYEQYVEYVATHDITYSQVGFALLRRRHRGDQFGQRSAERNYRQTYR